MEYPVNPNVQHSDFVKSWGAFKPHTTNLAVAGQRQKEAIMLMDIAGYR
jgi:iron(III) transport system substrate-binding protein